MRVHPLLLVLLLQVVTACASPSMVTDVTSTSAASTTSTLTPATSASPTATKGPDEITTTSTLAEAVPEGIRTTVTRVVDGDTVDVAWGGERVRLIGIDTPEVHSGTECYGREASRHAAELMGPGTEVVLELDVAKRDRYGRVLAYLWRISDKLFLNEAMVADGYAQTYTVPPNVAYVDRLLAAQRAAREAGRGLWSSCPTGTPTTTAAATAAGPVGIVTIRYEACGNDVECYGDSEYVELGNNSAEAVDLAGWTVTDTADHRITIPSGFSVPAGETLRAYTGDGGDDPTAAYHARRPQAIWNNSGGDTATLIDPSGQVVDTYSYSS